MKKEITNSDLYNLVQIMQGVYNAKLQSRISNKIKKIKNELEKEIKTVEETRIEVFTKYGDLSEDKKSRILKEETKEEALKELKELFEDKITLEDHELKISDLGDKLSVIEIEVLEKLFDNDLEEQGGVK